MTKVVKRKGDLLEVPVVCGCRARRGPIGFAYERHHQGRKIKAKDGQFRDVFLLPSGQRRSATETSASDAAVPKSTWASSPGAHSSRRNGSGSEAPNSFTNRRTLWYLAGKWCSATRS